VTQRLGGNNHPANSAAVRVVIRKIAKSKDPTTNRMHKSIERGDGGGNGYQGAKIDREASANSLGVADSLMTP